MGEHRSLHGVDRAGHGEGGLLSGGFSLTAAAGPLAALTAGLLFRVWVLMGMDLADIPGPGSAQLMHLAMGGVLNNLDHRALAVLLELHGDPLLATRCFTVLAGMASLVGLTMAAWALGGRSAATAAALLGGAWSQHVHGSMLLGADGLAAGLAWIGVGACWLGARGHLTGLPLGFLGGLSFVAGAATKATVLPVAACLLLTPFLGRRGSPGALLASVGSAAGVSLGLALLEVRVDPAVDVPSLGPLAVARGIQVILDMSAGSATHDGAIPEIMLLGAAGVLLPARLPRARILLGLLLVVTVGMTAASLHQGFRPRYLVPSAMGFLVLGGVAMSWLSVVLRRAGPLRLAPLAVVLSFMTMDTLAFLHAWGAQRHTHVGTNLPTLPEPPQAWRERYRRLPFDTSLSLEGGKALLEIGRMAPPYGVAIPRLQDGREAHLLAGAALAGAPGLVLTQERCCHGDGSIHRCAQATVAALNRAGALLVLPTLTSSHDRVPVEDVNWHLTLARVAGDELVKASPRWLTRPAGGAGGALPCSLQGARAPSARR